MSYFDAFLAPVAAENREAYAAHARDAWSRVFAPAGALRMVEAWADDVPDGEVTSFPMAVKLAEGERVVVSWIEWPDKATRDACHERMRAGETEEMGEMPFDGRRMIYGGFVPLMVVGAKDGAAARA
jgi:uncharacterized protein YbaA (DUF1428 family)